MDGRGQVDYSTFRKLASGPKVYQYINPDGEKGGWVTKNVKVFGDSYINNNSTIICGHRDSMELINVKIGPGCHICIKDIKTTIESCSISDSDIRIREVGLSEEEKGVLKLEDCRVHDSYIWLPDKFKFYHFKKLSMSNKSFLRLALSSIVKIDNSEFKDNSTFFGQRITEGLLVNKLYLQNSGELEIDNIKSVIIKNCNLFDHDRKDKADRMTELLILKDFTKMGGESSFKYEKSTIING